MHLTAHQVEQGLISVLDASPSLAGNRGTIDACLYSSLTQVPASVIPNAAYTSPSRIKEESIMKV